MRSIEARERIEKALPGPERQLLDGELTRSTLSTDGFGCVDFLVF